MRSLPGPPEAQPRRTPTSPVIGPADHDRTGRSCATHAPAAPLRSQFHTPARCSALPRRFAAAASASAPLSVHGERGRSEPCGSQFFEVGAVRGRSAPRARATLAHHHPAGEPGSTAGGIDTSNREPAPAKADRADPAQAIAHLCAAGMHGLRRISGDAGDRRHSSDAAIQTARGNRTRGINRTPGGRVKAS
jgi:hypothetical protein